MTKKKKRLGIKLNMRTYAIIIAIIFLWIIFGLTTNGSFLTTRNVSNLFRQMSSVGILATGALLVIVSGGIDLSVGLMAGFIGCLGAYFMTYSHWSTPLVVLVMIVAGAVFGLVQGYIISYLDVPAFIVTLGFQMLLKGLVLWLTEGITISPINEDFLVFGQAYVPHLIGWIIAAIAVILIFLFAMRNRKNSIRYGFDSKPLTADLLKAAGFSVLVLIFAFVMNDYNGIPFQVLLLFLLVLVLTFVAEKTVFGRSIYAIGGNEEAVRYAGINVEKNRMIVYVVSGVTAAIAGIVLTARQAAGLPSTGQSLELDAIAAAVIGGASMTGGVGRVYGAIIGALLMATIDNGMAMLNMETFWQYIVKGVILIAAVLFDIKTKGK